MAQGPMSSVLVTIRSPSGSRSPKSAFTGLLKKLPTDFDEILRRARVWPENQLITFWWGSGSPSGSESPFRITIRIREELPQFYYAGVRRRSELSERLLVFLLILPFQFHYGWLRNITQKCIINTVYKSKCLLFSLIMWIINISIYKMSIIHIIELRFVEIIQPRSALVAQ